MDIYFAKSMAGHDKGQVYYITKEEGDFVYLANGTTKPLDGAKKKNKKHIQIMKKIPEEIAQVIASGMTNESVKRAIRLYQAHIDGSQAKP